jgi:hypothetical protein
MKKIAFLLILQVITQTVVKADVCDKDEILKLMAEKSYIDLKDQSFCVDFSSFPNVRVKMAEGNYDLNGTRTISDKIKGQDDGIKNLVNLLNSTETLADGQKFTIQTKGIADGTFNSTTQHDENILSELADQNGVILTAKINSIIRAQDPEGAKAILEEIAKINLSQKKPEDAGLKFSAIKDDSKLKSMIRNFYLARSRGTKLCNDIFASTTACESSGEISPTLDNGKHCFEGCCDQRRGAIVDIVAPQKEMMSVGGSGVYKPPFKSPSRTYQGKLQMAASMSVFDLPLKEDSDLEDQVLNKKKFSENYTKDHQRFKDALAGSGCENNPFAIDSIRRIYWTVKGMKDTISPDLYQAIVKNDFAKAYSLYEKANSEKNQNDLNVLSSLFSGANTNLAVFNRANCPKASDKGQDWGEDTRTIRIGKAPYTKCEVISDSLELKGKSITDIHKLINTDRYDDQSIFVIQDQTNRENFYLYDRKKNSKILFTFDKKSEHCDGLGVSPNYKSPKKESQKSEDFTTACLQALTRTGFKMPKEFYPQAPQVSGVVPSDPLNCLSAAKAIDHEMRDQNPNGAPVLSREAESAQKPFCKVQSNNSLSMTINPKELTVIGGAANGKQGFMCTGCSSGVVYNQSTKKFDYFARQISQPVGGESGNQKELASKTWSQGSSNKDHPLTMASIKHMRSYVIPNCGTSCEDACACLRKGNIESRLKEPGVNIIDFTDLSSGNKKLVGSYPGDRPPKDGEAGSFACIYTPPVPHTCSYNPLGETSDEDHSLAHQEEKCPIVEKLKGLPKTSKVTITDDLIKQYKSNCSQISFPSTEGQCNNAINFMCQQKRMANNCPESKQKSNSGGSKAKSQ